MKIFTWISLLSSILFLYMADIVYHTNKKAAANRIFAIFNLLIAWWAFTEFMCRQAETPETARLWLRIGAIMSFIPALFFHFTMVFTERNKLVKKSIIYLLLYCPALFFTIINAFTNLISRIPLKKPWGYSMINIPSSNSFIFFLFHFWILILTIIIFYFFINFSQKTRNPEKKAQIRYFILGFITIVVIAVIDIVNRIINFDIPENSTIALVWLNGCIGYAMWKYELFALDHTTAAESIVATMPDSLLLINLYGTITKINPAFQVLSGYQEAELTGKSFQILFPQVSDTAEIRAELNKENTIINREIELRTKDGAMLPAQLSCSAIKDKRNQTAGYVIILHDITEHKNIEESLQTLALSLVRSNRELQDFAYIASHDLQEPLRKILVFGDYLRTTYAEKIGEEGKDYLRRMENAAARMQGLIDGLLNYSRVTTNAGPFAAVDLNRIIKEVLNDLEIRIKETGGKIEVDPLPSIQADALQMRQLFQNLIGNALKYHKKDIPPLIRIKGTVTGKFLQIIITDNGIGFDEKYADQIFGIFQRLVGKSEYEGAGIGLAICKKIAERHNGKIIAMSVPGEGSSFTIQLSLR